MLRWRKRLAGRPMMLVALALIGALLAALPTAAGASVTLPAATELVNVNSGQCLTVSGASQAEAAAVVQEPCTGASDQLWSLVPFGSGYHIVSQLSAQCLNVDGGSTASLATLIQWPCQSTTQTNDQWTLNGVGSYDQIVNVRSKLCANISGGSQAAGGSAIQYPCQTSTSLNDQFELFLPAAPATTLQSGWTPVIALPVPPVAVANLPNGTVLMWSAYSPYTYDGDIGNNSSQTYTAIFSPATLTATEAIETSAGSDMFCPGTAVLPSGQVLVNGGTSSPKTSIFDPPSGTWAAAAEMNIPRGYEADTVVSGGQVLTLGGSWSGGEGGKNGELWNPVTGWTELTGVPPTNIIGPDPQGVYRGDNHLWMFAVSNGNVFQAGPSSQMNWITTGGTGSITSAGNRGNDPFSINGNAVLYDINKILKVGGAVAYQQDETTTTYASTAAYVINIQGGPTAPVTVQQVANMSYPRAFANSVVLPDGTVVVVGGQTIPQPFTDTAAVLTPELWNPKTQTFNLLEPMQVPRTYHSTALLLNDGRVFVGGGGLCGVGCANNHLDAQILTPPYLYTAAGALATQARITAAPGTAVLGSAMTVSTNVPVSSFVLMRLSATTHTVNNDQRRVPVFSVPLSSGAYDVLIPADPGIVLPGYYFLFALDAKGVPSVAATLQITAPAVEPPTGALACASENGTCTLPSGITATVWFGAGTTWATIGNLTGSIACNNATFGDPNASVVKSCVYLPTPPAAALPCALEHANCTLPAGKTATVWFGADTHWTYRTGLSGTVACNDTTFTDPDYGVVKACSYQSN